MDAASQPAASRPSARIFYGWWIVVAYFILNVYWAGTLGAGLTVFFTPVRQSFGWSAALVAGIFSLENLAASLLAPAVGAVFDRRGARGLMLGAGGLSGTGLILLAHAGSLLPFVAAFVIVAAGFAIWGAGTGPAIAALWFERRRGLAMGLIVSGSSCGGLLVPLWSSMVSAAGWRVAVTIAGAALLGLTLPLSLVLRHRPRAYGLRPFGAAPGASDTRGAGLAGQSGFGAALRSRRFWIVTASATAVAMGSAATTVHILPSLREVGVTAGVAVGAVTALNLLGIPGRLGVGWLTDRAGAVLPFVASGALQGAGLLLFGVLGWGHMLLVPAVLAFGLGSNVFLASSLLMVRAFGTPAFGRIQGVLLLSTGLGRFVGPIVAGAVHDHAGGYPPAYVGLGALSLAAALPLLRLRDAS